MSKLMIALCATAGLGLAVPVAAQMVPTSTTSTPMSKDGYNRAKTHADAQYSIDKKACSSLSGNAKDICVAQAKGKDDVAKADALAAYENTPKARESARVALAGWQVTRLGADFLKSIEHYARDASAAGATFVEIQNTMLFATVGQRAE